MSDPVDIQTALSVAQDIATGKVEPGLDPNAAIEHCTLLAGALLEFAQRVEGVGQDEKLEAVALQIFVGYQCKVEPGSCWQLARAFFAAKGNKPKPDLKLVQPHSGIVNLHG